LNNQYRIDFNRGIDDSTYGQTAGNPKTTPTIDIIPNTIVSTMPIAVQKSTI